jgi:hypothetical protein
MLETTRSAPSLAVIDYPAARVTRGQITVDIAEGDAEGDFRPFVSIEVASNRVNGSSLELAGYLTPGQIDALISALTLARDAARARRILSPVKPAQRH